MEYKIYCPFCGTAAWVANKVGILCESDDCRAMIGVEVQASEGKMIMANVGGTGIYKFETRESSLD